MNPQVILTGVATGLLCSLIAFLLWRSIRSFQARAIRVKGKVIELIPDDGVYYPVIEIQSEELGDFVTQLSFGSNHPVGQVGETKSFLVDPKDRENIQVDCEGFLYLGVVILGLIGFFGVFVFGLVGVTQLFLRGK